MGHLLNKHETMRYTHTGTHIQGHTPLPRSPPNDNKFPSRETIPMESTLLELLNKGKGRSWKDGRGSRDVEVGQLY